MKKIIFFALVWTTYAQSQQEKSIPFHQTTIDIDGKIDEAIWQQIPEYTGFYNHLPTDEGMAAQQTVIKLFHNGEKLFLSAVYHDNTSDNQISSLKRDALGEVVGSSDAIVFILDTQNQQQSAYYFAVNIGGAMVDGLIERVSDNDGFDINSSWNTVWKAKTSSEGNQKSYEIAIPLKALNFNKDQSVFGIQCYVRDIKKNSWTILTEVKRNYRLFDLRFTASFRVENLPKSSASRFAITPSVTLNHQNDRIINSDETTFKPSLDVQYNLSSSLKLDATINPDFSQIDVDEQVTNLTRFAVFFPERRNFFLENADLFSNLGADGVNPFYSRKVGAASDIQFGVKLSGNVTPTTRIGIMDIQTDREQTVASQNVAAFIGEQQLSKNFSATAFLINRQETDESDFINDYNRVAGLNLVYTSTNNKLLGRANVAKSFSNGIDNENNFYNAGLWYNNRTVNLDAAIKDIGTNYITDVGFTPRLYNFDAINKVTVREGYTQATLGAEFIKYLEDSDHFNRFRYANARNNTYWDREGKISQSSTFYNAALFFKNLSAVYINLYTDYVNLKYPFDPLGNGNEISADTYSYSRIQLGYNSTSNKKVIYRGYTRFGEYYDGNIATAFAQIDFRLLPLASLGLSYEINHLDLKTLGNETFHLSRFEGQVFFSNRLNWTTYLQYNSQIDNFNINSRMQWEYKPLSYIYLVVTDNFNNNFKTKNWGVAFKMNYRFDF